MRVRGRISLRRRNCDGKQRIRQALEHDERSACGHSGRFRIHEPRFDSRRTSATSSPDYVVASHISRTLAKLKTCNECPRGVQDRRRVHEGVHEYNKRKERTTCSSQHLASENTRRDKPSVVEVQREPVPAGPRGAEIDSGRTTSSLYCASVSPPAAAARNTIYQVLLSKKQMAGPSTEGTATHRWRAFPQLPGLKRHLVLEGKPRRKHGYPPYQIDIKQGRTQPPPSPFSRLISPPRTTLPFGGQKDAEVIVRM